MIDIKLLRDDPNKVQAAAKAKNKTIEVDTILKLDKEVRSLKQEIESLAAQKNQASEHIASAHGGERDRMIEEMKMVGKKEEELKTKLTPIQDELNDLLWKIPNPCLDSVKIGKDETENTVIKTVGDKPAFTFTPKDHVELGEILDIIDIKTAAKVSGSRFAYLKGDAVLMQFALVQLVMATLTNKSTLESIIKSAGLECNAKPFTPVLPPVMIKPDVMQKMARLDAENADERYYLKKDNVYLVGSAEHALGPMYMKTSIPEADLPIRMIGYSSAFRREAGSYGKDTKGIIRVHQFDKLEMESFTTSEAGETEQLFFVAIQEYLLNQLELPYQIIEMCTGDTGTPDAKQIDIETWIPTQETYRETHTADYMTNYQSRRLGTKIKHEDGTSEFAHMNDATAIAIGRLLVAILENNQQKDGTVKIPTVLQPYMGGKTVIEPR